MLLGCADGGYYLLINQRVDRVAYTVTDLVTQAQTVSRADLDTIMLAAGELMKPFVFTDQGRVTISSVFKSSATGTTKIMWQYSGAGTYKCGNATSGCASRIGAVGATPVLPNNMTLNANENVIVVEVFYRFTPMFISDMLFPATDLYRAAVYKPRLSALTTTPS